MNGVGANPSRLIWVIHDPYTSESGVNHDTHEITQAIQLSQGIRASSPPPLVPIRGVTSVFGDGLQGSSTQSSNSTVDDVMPKRVLVQTDIKQDAANLSSEKNPVLSKGGHNKRELPTKEQAKNDEKELCKFCSRSFETRKAVLNHQYQCVRNPKRPKGRVECSSCNKTFTRKAHLEKHLNSDGCRKIPSYRMCHFPDCKFKYRFRTVFMDHLKEKHNVDIEPGKEMVFDNWDQFFEWKDSEETRTWSYYSQQFGRKNNRAYFYCQHDGPDREKISDDQNTEKKRAPNQKGKIKTGKQCYSMIHVHGVNKEGQLRVTYFPTHSHQLNAGDLRFQPLNAATKQYIRQQIAKGVSPEKISELLKEEKSGLNSSVDEMLTRTDFISVQALREYRRLYSKTANCLVADDPTAAQLVENLRTGSYDPVLIFKPSGGSMIAGPPANLPQDTFVLGIQTKEQLEMMNECSKAALIVVVNCDVTVHKCKLVTIFGIDEMNKGYPVAHCVTSDMDENILSPFYRALKEKSPDVRVNGVITEGFDPTVINAARVGFEDSSIQHFVCTWAFLRDVQRKLCANIEDETLASSMFEGLCDITLAKTESEFDELLANFRKKYANHTSSFLRYLIGVCVPKKTEWALCFRDLSKIIESSLFAESYNSILNDAYREQQLNIGLDTLIHLLIETDEDYYARRWTTGIHTSPSVRKTVNQNVNLRHSKSIALPHSKVEQVIKNHLWEITSRMSDKVQQVVRCSLVCTNPNVCYFRCASPTCVDLCVHLYLCTCKDENPLCKHIHKVHSMNVSKVNWSDPPSMTCQVDDPVEDLYHKSSVESALLGESSRSSVDEEEEILDMLNKLRDHVENGGVKKLHPHILKTLSELNAQCSQTTPIKRKRQFASFKKRKTDKTDSSDEDFVESLKSPNPTGFILDMQSYIEVSLPVASNLSDNHVEIVSPTSHSTRVNIKEQFTPPIDYVDNPNQVVFKFDDEDFTLLSIKSLEPWLPATEVRLLQKASEGEFRVGWIYENIVNAYLSVLASTYGDFVPLETTVIQSLLTADKQTFKSFWEGLQTQKVIFVPIITNNYYTSAAVLVDEQTIITYDPLENSSVDSESLNALKRGLEMAFPQKATWTLMSFPGTQKDITQSGVNVCVFAEQVARGEVHYQTVNDASNFRKVMYESIFGFCLKRETFSHYRCDICKEVARAGSIGTIKCVRCSQVFHRMCLQLDPNETCICPLILVGCS